MKRPASQNLDIVLNQHLLTKFFLLTAAAGVPVRQSHQK